MTAIADRDDADDSHNKDLEHGKVGRVEDSANTLAHTQMVQRADILGV